MYCCLGGRKLKDQSIGFLEQNVPNLMHCPFLSNRCLLEVGLVSLLLQECRGKGYVVKQLNI